MKSLENSVNEKEVTSFYEESLALIEEAGQILMMNVFIYRLLNTAFDIKEETISIKDMESVKIIIDLINRIVDD